MLAPDPRPLPNWNLTESVMSPNQSGDRMGSNFLPTSYLGLGAAQVNFNFF